MWSARSLEKGLPQSLCSKRPILSMPLCLVVESCLLACTTGTWCVDTGATNHVCNSLQGFQETRRLARGEIDLLMGDTSLVAAVAVGVVTLFFEGGKFLILDDCLYVHVMDIHHFSIKILFSLNSMMILYVVGCCMTIYTC